MHYLCENVIHLMNKKKKTPQEDAQSVELKCLEEVNQVLQKYGCIIDVTFSQEVVMGKKLLNCTPVIVKTK